MPCFRDGGSALRLGEEFRPDVVFSDIGMPGMDGYELARRVRALDGFRPLLIALTGDGQDEDCRKALEAGFDHHVVKPASVDSFRSPTRNGRRGTPDVAPAERPDLQGFRMSANPGTLTSSSRSRIVAERVEQRGVFPQELVEGLHRNIAFP